MAQIMVLVADLALLMAAWSGYDQHSTLAGALPWMIVLGVWGVAAAFGFWASRRLWTSTLLIIVFLIPAFHEPAVDPHLLGIAFVGTLLGWAIGLWAGRGRPSRPGE